jgi:hypothetical protein
MRISLTSIALLACLTAFPAFALPLAPMPDRAGLLGVSPVAGGCGAGYRRTLSGHCTPDVYPHHEHRCQPGMHAVRATSASGYRCVFDR